MRVLNILMHLESQRLGGWTVIAVRHSTEKKNSCNSEGQLARHLSLFTHLTKGVRAEGTGRPAGLVCYDLMPVPPPYRDFKRVSSNKYLLQKGILELFKVGRMVSYRSCCNDNRRSDELVDC